MKTLVFTLIACTYFMLNASAQSWLISGNANTNPDTNFIGTKNKRDVVFRTANIERIRLTKNGKVGIGIDSPVQKLDVSGNINLSDGSGFYINNVRVLLTSGPIRNIFVGQDAGNNNGGIENTGVGYRALASIKNEGTSNVAVGANALDACVQGSGNTAIGPSSMHSTAAGQANSAVGGLALGNNVTGNINSALGFNADVNSGDLDNVTVIGHSALGTASNQVRVGSSDVTSIGGFAEWTNISDGRAKKNIKENVPGLIFINRLKPVTYLQLRSDSRR